jgi:hypothetical protein
VDETRRAIAGFPDRAEAFCREWEEEYAADANYPDAPSEEEGDRFAVAAGAAFS